MAIITGKYLKDNPNHIFVYGDNSIRKGNKGAASLRNFSNTYGFVTKRFPCSDSSCFYKPEEYEHIFKKEIKKLKEFISNNPDKMFLISKLGGGLANKYKIWEKIISPNIKKELEEFENIILLYEEKQYGYY